MEINLRGADQFTRRMLAAAARVEAPPAEVWVELRDDFLAANKRVFTQNSTWAPLAPATLRKKRADGKPTKPLAGGTLEKSLTVPGAAGGIFRVEGKSMVLGTGERTAWVHQRGRQVRARMPIRSPILLGRGVHNRWARKFGHAVMSRQPSAGEL